MDTLEIDKIRVLEGAVRTRRLTGKTLVKDEENYEAFFEPKRRAPHVNAAYPFYLNKKWSAEELEWLNSKYLDAGVSGHYLDGSEDNGPGSAIKVDCGNKKASAYDVIECVKEEHYSKQYELWTIENHLDVMSFDDWMAFWGHNDVHSCLVAKGGDVVAAASALRLSEGNYYNCGLIVSPQFRGLGTYQLLGALEAAFAGRTYYALTSTSLAKMICRFTEGGQLLGQFKLKSLSA